MGIDSVGQVRLFALGESVFAARHRIARRASHQFEADRRGIIMGKLLRVILVGAAFLLPGWAQAQILDFDSVCATAPCSIGTSYATSGVSFTPSTTQIVAAGTNGLTGTNGGKYLSVAAFPYQQSIANTRQAAFASLDLSRANTSSGTVTVQITALRAGSPVGSTTVTLTTVNTWSNASLSIPAGFDTLFIDPTGGANLTIGIDNVRFGGTCNGFSDVTPAASFCNATEWLANRGITLGCVAGQYCPNDSVTRASMALFMQRLGAALTPTRLFAEALATPAWLTAPATPEVMCQTADYVPAFAQRAAIQVQFYGRTTDTAEPWLLPVYSLDAGATWIFASGIYTIAATTGAGTVAVTSESFNLDLQPGKAYRFGTRVFRNSGVGNFVSGFTACKTAVNIINRNSASAPFDPAASAGIHGPLSVLGTN
jgi:hypothetical protein